MIYAALALFAVTYALILIFGKYRPYIALTSGLIFIITGIGILRKEGFTVKNSDFFKIGIPFTFAAIVPAYIYLWFMFR